VACWGGGLYNESSRAQSVVWWLGGRVEMGTHMAWTLCSVLVLFGLTGACPFWNCRGACCLPHT
jgi:hypothetical protein